MEEKRKALYNALSGEYDLGTYEDFTAKLNDESKRRALYDAAGQDYNLGTYEEYSEKLGFGPSGSNVVPMFKDEPNASLGEPDAERGVGAGAREGWKGLKAGFQNLWGETANVFTGSSQDSVNALNELNDMVRQGKDVAAETENAWTDAGREIRTGAMELLPGWMIKGWKDRVLARAEKEKVLDDIREALGEAGGDVDKARVILEQKAQEMSYGDEQIAKAAEKFADVKPTEGFGAWVGSNAVQMIPSASALIVGAVTKSPAAAKAIGMIGMGGMTAATAGTSMYEARQAGATDQKVWKVGITDGMIEYLTEKLPFDRYTSRIIGKVKGEVAQDLFSALRTNKATKTELEKLLVKANERLGGKLFSKKNLKDYLADMLAEGASEFSAEALQTMTSMMYENPEDYPTINEILTNGWEGAKAGFFMGAVLGGASKTMEHTQNRKRRMDKGSVDVALVDFGDGVKDVAEVVEYDASSNTAIVLHDGSFEKVSGDAIADGYRFSYEEFENARLRQMEDEAVVSGNVTEGQIQGLEDNIARDIDEIKALAPEMTESEISAVLQSEMAVEPDTPLGDAVAKYQEDMARHDELVAAKREADAAKKEAVRSEIETVVGQRFWVQESGEDDGSGIIPVSETVEEVVYADGRVGYVVGSDESGNLTMVYTDGTKGFSSRAEITDKMNSGEIVSDTPMGLEQYLEYKVSQNAVAAEQTRMAEEHAFSVEEMIATHPQGSVINVGTEEAKIEVPIIAPPTKDGVIVQMLDGTTPMLTWEDVAHAEKKEITPKTDAQLNQSIVDEYRVAYTPAASAPSQTAQQEEQVKRTSPANPIPLKADGSVDQTALWNNDPERWAQWNDEQRQDGGANSLAYVSGAIAKEQAKMAELQAAYAAESDFDARDAIEKEITDTQARVERLTAIQQGYVAQTEAAAAPVAETQPDSTLTARMASEMTQQELNDLDESYDIILSQTRVPEEKARLLQEYLDRIAEGSTPIKVLTRDNYEDVMRAAGCPEADIIAVGRVMKRLKPGRAIAGFVSAESIFVMADGIPSISEARVTYVHERQHVINSLMADKVREMAIALGNKANALAVLEKFVGVDGLAEYENDPLLKLADEIIARCMEIAYTTEEFSVDLQSKGLSDSVISIIEEIDNEQRNDKSLIAARRSAHAGISRRTNAAQDGRNSGQVSGGILVGEENRSAGVGGQGTGTGSTGEGAEVISEEQLNAPNSGTAKQITATDGEVLADTDGKGGVRFSIRTWNEGGRDYLTAWLANDTTLTEEEKADIIARMDEFYKNALLYSDTYAPFGTWSDAGVRYDNNGNPLMSVIKANGDYAMNLDFSLVCKKRRPLNRLLRTLVNRNAFATYTLRERELAEINWILQEHGFEVACALCFVDSKRYRVTGVADVFALLYNRLVKALAPKGVKVSHFNYNDNPNVEVVENGLDTLPEDQINWAKFDRLVSGLKPNSVEYKVAQYLREHPEARKLVDATDFIEAEGFESVKENNPDLLKFYNMKKGTGGPKASFGDVQYLNDILKKEKSFDAEKAYAVGGVRLQSFSDFVPHMYFDYMQLFAELAAKKLPLHAYTKEVLFAKIFGLTGAKINMSLVPAVVEGGIAPGLDAEGNYAWADPVADAEGNVIQQGQSFPYDEAMTIQRAEGYSKNCGVIAVGISDAHIEKMLDDPNIPFIIPYHKSSLNAIVARMTNIDQYKDYTNVQNTRKASGSKLDKGAKDFNFNEYLHGLGESGTPQQAAQAYLDWCRENNYKPKFSQFAYHPNYYKLLQDFNTIDLATGEYAPQGAVTMTFPTEESAFGNVETLIQQGLREDAELEEKMEQEIDDIADQVLARLEEISKEPKMSEKQQAKKMAELADERTAKIKAKAKGPIDLIEEAKKAVAREERLAFRVISQENYEMAERMIDNLAGRPYFQRLEGEYELGKLASNYAELADIIMAIDANKAYTPVGTSILGFFAENPNMHFPLLFNDSALSKETANAFAEELSKVNDPYALFFMRDAWRIHKTSLEQAGLGVKASSTTKYNKAIDARAEEIKAAEVKGTAFNFKKQESSLDEIDAIFKQLNKDPELALLHDKVMGVARKLGVKVSFAGKRGRTAGESLGDKVSYDYKFFNSPAVADQKKCNTITHELIHSITVYAIYLENQAPTALTDGMLQAVGILRDVYNQIARDPAFKGEYGVSDVYEMVAELSNAQFRDKLKEKNLFQRILDALKRLLGIDTVKEDSAYQVLSDTLDYIIENYDEAAFDAYALYASRNRSYGRMMIQEESLVPGHKKGQPMLSDAEMMADESFRITKNTKTTIEKWFNKAGVDAEMTEATINYLDYAFEDTTEQLCAAKWYLNGKISLPDEDEYKVRDAVKVAKQNKVDALSYASPMDILNTFGQPKSKVKPIDPDTVKEFSNKKELAEGIVVYDVQDDFEGQAAVRKIIDTHWGEDANPWCIAARTNGDLEKAKDMWLHYSKYPKRIAFRNGKLLAFYASANDKTWWDRNDDPHTNIPYSVKSKEGEYEVSTNYELKEGNKKAKKVSVGKSDKKGRTAYFVGNRLESAGIQDGERNLFYSSFAAGATLSDSTYGVGLSIEIQYGPYKNVTQISFERRTKDEPTYYVRVGYGQNGVRAISFVEGARSWDIRYGINGDQIFVGRAQLNFDLTNELSDVYSGAYHMYRINDEEYEIARGRKKVGIVKKGEKVTMQMLEAFGEDGAPAGALLDFINDMGWNRSDYPYPNPADADLLRRDDEVREQIRKVENEINEIAGGRYLSSVPAIRFRVTAEQDKAYMDAVEAGDMEAAQSMVYDAARAAGYNSPRLYHGTDAEFTTFDKEFNDPGSEGFFFTNSEEMAASYGDNIKQVYLRVEDPYVIEGNGRNWNQLHTDIFSVIPEIEDQIRVHEIAMKSFLDRGKITQGQYDHFREKYYDKVNFIKDESKDSIFDVIKKYIYRWQIRNFKSMLNVERTRDFEWFLQQLDSDVNIIFKDITDFGPNAADFYIARDVANDVYVTTNPKNIKSADAVTYDDEGKVIPLSERFNLESSDIRFRTIRTDEQREQLFDNAKEKFGLTNNFKVAGYMLPDGSLLDFSEANDGGDPNQRTQDHREVADLIMDEGREYEYRYEYVLDFVGEGAIRMLPEYAGFQLSVPPTAEQRSKLMDYIYKYNGEVIMEITDENGSPRVYMEYNKRTSPSRIFRDMDGFFNEGIVPGIPPLRFRIANENQVIFVSNAAKAVEGIKQEKATPEQWLKMIEKNGGLKAGEDKWMGLSDFLKASDKKTLTKQEVLDFINENMIIIDEQHYSDKGVRAEADRILNERYPGWEDAFSFDWDPFMEEPHSDIYDEVKAARLYNETHEDQVETDEDGDIINDADYDKVEEFGAELAGIWYGRGKENTVREINGIRKDYTTAGLENNHEIALTVPTIKPWNIHDETHFGDAGGGRAVAWIRFGDTKIYAKTKEGEEYKAFVDNMLQRYHINEEVELNRFGTIVIPQELLDALNDEQMNELQRLKTASMLASDKTEQSILVIDEVQSKRHQEGREKGYVSSRIKEEMRKAAEDAKKAFSDYESVLKEKYGEEFVSAQTDDEIMQVVTREEYLRYDRLRNTYYDARLDYSNPRYDAVPDAPFDKNWHELAMKRMLRYAAENGYDAIAWTTGDQQADRYDLSRVVKKINASKPTKDGERIVNIYYRDEYNDFKNLVVDKEGKVVQGDYSGNALADVIGKEMALQIMNADESTEFKGEGLKIGGEGMRGFYDKMLPAFMNKYGKKWGVKVEDIDLPNLGKSGRTMHSIPVTEEMKASVMEGQVMFRTIPITQEVQDEMDAISATAIVRGNYLKAPNGADTNLTPEQWAMVRTKNFLNWFGDWINDPENASKVVDENGEPMVVFHGTNLTVANKGVPFWTFYEDQHFGTKAQAEEMARAGRSDSERKVYETFLNIKNIKRVKDTPQDWIKTHSEYWEPIFNEAKSEGYDGLVYVNEWEDSNNKADSFVVFSPNQIKSATDNTGEFSTEDKDIRYRVMSDVNTNPTEAQKKAGNYKMGHIRLDGYNITIENPKGSVRRGTDSKGNAWENTLNNDYGYIRGTEGVDGDHIDVYLSDNPTEGNVFVIDQVNPETREFDEHKVMYGFNSAEEARKAYLANFNEGWNGLGTITEVSKDEFKKWIESSHRKTKPFSEYKSVRANEMQATDESELRYRVVSDQETLDRLNSEPTIKVYRAMQIIDGKLYPPMSAKIDGELRQSIELGQWEEAEERPDLVDEKGRFKLDKGNKSSLKARYNPYFHTSPTPLNDQFSSAQTRPELVTVEVEVPESELTSGYKAEKAKDSVGKMEWKAGVIQSKLSGTRTVILSRWDKPVRIVPDSEVADVIVDMFEGRDITMPSNVVTPSLRAELEKRGVPFVETDNQGNPVEEVSFRVTGTSTDEVVANGLQLTPAQTAEVAANIFAALPEESRKKITEGLNGDILGLKDAILQIPTSLASKENWNEEDKQMAGVVAEEMTKMAGEMTRPFSAEEGLWLLYNNLNKETDLISQASRALVQRNLGFDAETLAKQEQAKEDVRFRTVGDATSNARASLYNRGSVNVWTRLKESFVDMQASVEELVKAIEKRTGKDAQGFENILLALNQQSSKGLAAMESYTQKFLNPMFDEIRRIMDETKMKYEDVVRYVILKHGLERNKKLAQRDARAHYQEIYDDIISKITGMSAAQKRTYLTNAQLKKGDAKADLATLQAVDMSAMTDEEKREHKKKLAAARKAVEETEEHLKRAQKIASLSEQEAQDELDKIFEKIENGTDSVFKEMRENDYSGISSMFYDQLGVDRKNFSTEEQYQAALMEAKKDRYSSLKDIETAAEAEVKSFEGKTDTKELWKRINAATKETLRQQYEANMISKDQYLNLRDMFEYYVPLRGFKDNTAEDMYTYYRKPNSTGYTKPILGAEGRKTEAESPFGWIAAMAGSAIASNVKNEAKLALYYFVSNRPENGIATISKTWFVDSGEVDERGKKIFKPAYPPFSEDLSSAEGKAQYEIWQANMKELQKKGQAYEAGQRLNLGNAVVNISDANKPEHIVNVKVGGKDYTIIINGNPRAAQAINGDLNIEGTAQDYSALFGPVLRWMSSVNTSYNPEFWITNMMRDVAFTWMAVNTKEEPAYRRKFWKNYLKAFKVISLVAKNEKGTIGDSYLEQQYKDFVKYGGVTGYTQIKDSETWEKEIDNYLSSKDPKSVKNGKVMIGMKSAFHVAHRFGESLEQVSRFAAFLTARETGKSINEAINDAKEITVNFNRKGSGKMITLEEAKYLTGKNGQPLTKPQQWMVVGLSSIAPLGRRFIMFFNAAIQGLNATYKLMKKNPKRFAGWALGYAAVGMMNAVLHAMLDDDDDYLDIPQYERRNSLMIGGNGAYFKWALPQEARAFYALGDLAVETVMGRNPHQNFLGEALKIGTEILPVNPSEGWKAFMPSVAIPFIELALNEDYKGAPIYNEQKWLSEEEKERTAKWSSAYQGTGWTYVKISQGLNFITGGDKHDAGWINLQPEKLEHLVQSAFGGTIRTADKFINTISAALDPEEPITIRQTPFLNRFLTINDERFKNVHVNDVFDYYKADAEHALTLEKQYIKDRDMDSLTELRSSDEYQWAKIYGKYKKPLKAIQDKIKVADGTAEKKELMKQQDELKKRMIKEISEL